MADATTITESELIELLNSDDLDAAQRALETYLAPGGFDGPDIADGVTLEPDGIVPMGEDANKWAIKRVMAAANYLGTRRRHKRYREVIERYPDLTRAVGEGDSWFLHPWIEDVIDHLFGPGKPQFALKSYAGSGDELSDLSDQKDKLLEATSEVGAKYLFYSGGGNDIMGEELSDFVHPYTKKRDPADYLNQAFDNKLGDIASFYASLADDLARVCPDTTLVVHGYEYIRPGVDDPDEANHEHKGKWVGKQLREKGFPQNGPDSDQGVVLMRHMIDRFATTILAPLDDRTNVTWADTRDTVGVDEWRDEIHPNDVGMGKVAARIVAALD